MEKKSAPNLPYKKSSVPLSKFMPLLKSFRELIVHKLIRTFFVVTSVALEDGLVLRYGFPDFVEDVRLLGMKSISVSNNVTNDENLEKEKTKCEMSCTRKTSGTGISYSSTSLSPPASFLSYFSKTFASVRFVSPILHHFKVQSQDSASETQVLWGFYQMR